MVLIEMVKHSQKSQNSKFAMSLQYPKLESRDKVFFLFLQCDAIIIDEPAFSKYSK